MRSVVSSIVSISSPGLQGSQGRGVGEFLAGDEALGLEADIDKDVGRGDLDDLALEDLPHGDLFGAVLVAVEQVLVVF